MSQNWFSYSASGNFAGTFRFSSSSTNTRGNNVSGTVSGARRTEHVSYDGSGVTVRTTAQNLGERPVSQVRRFDREGREIAGGPGGSGTDVSRRIEDVTDSARVEEGKKE